MIDYFEAFTRLFTIGYRNAQFSFVTFSRSLIATSTSIMFNQSTDQSTLHNAISNLTYIDWSNDTDDNIATTTSIMFNRSTVQLTLHNAISNLTYIDLTNDTDNDITDLIK